MQRVSWVMWIAVAVGCGSVQAKPDASHDGPGGDAARDSSIDGGPIQQMAAMWLKLEDTPTDGVIDSVGTHVTTCTACPTPVAGRVGSAYDFASTRLTTATASDLQPGTGFTLALWARVDVAPSPSIGNATIACKNNGDLDCTFAISVSPTLVPEFYSSSDQNSNFDGITTMPLGTWHHIAVTWNGQTKTIFFDGAMDRSAPATTMSNVATGGMTFGERQSTAMPLSFMGAVDEVVFFTRPLTATEIAQLATP